MSTRNGLVILCLLICIGLSACLESWEQSYFNSN